MFVSLLPKQWHLMWLAHKSPGVIILLSAGLQHYALSASDASVSSHSAAKLPYLPNLVTVLSAQTQISVKHHAVNRLVLAFFFFNSSAAPVVAGCMLHHHIFYYYCTIINLQ